MRDVLTAPLAAYREARAVGGGPVAFVRVLRGWSVRPPEWRCGVLAVVRRATQR